MLDRLLGRASLKERVAELEEEKRHLERQLDAEEERRAEAAPLSSPRWPTCPRSTRWLSASPRSAADSTSLGDRTEAVARAAPCLAVTDDAGLLSACLSVPVPPEPFAGWDDHVQFERGWFEPTGPHTVALVRSDLFALGEYDGRERTAFHGFDSELKSQHSKGGFSQSRFERLRDQQIASHVERCRAAIDEVDPETLYVVGEGSVIHELEERAAVTRTVDATGDPEDGLADAVRSLWTVRLVVP